MSGCLSEELGQMIDVVLNSSVLTYMCVPLGFWWLGCETVPELS